MTNASRAHDEAVIELLREDPSFADEYLAAAMEEANQDGGREALLAALRHVAEAQGMAGVAERAGIPRESLYRVLSPNGNPTIKTLLAVLDAASRTSCTARFSTGLYRLIDLATVTPSLVTVTPPIWCSDSISTVCPPGPRVDATASDILFIPFFS